MNDAKPIQRAVALQPLSREHHQGLLFVWKIREGIKKGISIDRLRAYTGWYFKEHIRPHFFQEEKILQPLMGDHPLAQRMNHEHQMIRELIIDIDTDTLKGDLVQLADLLDKHIRFEERELFNYLQETLDKEKLDALTPLLAEHEECCVEWKDEFWVEKKV